MMAACQIFLGRGGGVKLPYDAEVEYIETTSGGGQYIDTGFVPKSDSLIFDITMSRDNDDTVLVGYGLSWREGMHIQIYSGNGINLHYGGKVYYIWTTGSAARKTRINITFGDGHAKSENLDNGTIVSAELSPADFSANTKSIWLLNSNPGTTNGVNRCYGFSISDSGEKLMDLIPVRFTNEQGVSDGAMYDRVSGQLFRNQGTGAFTYGGDVYSVPVETSQYVQDGLVAMWDGTENAGVGKHSTAVGAVNLAGSAELVFPSNLAKWSMGERSFDLSLIYHTDTNGRITIPVDTFNLSQFSTEICLLRGSDSTGEFGLVQDGVSYLNELSGASTALFRAYNSVGGIVINAQPNIGDTTAPRTLAFTYDGTTAKFYADGELKTSAAMELRAAFNAGLVRIGSAYLYNSGSIFDIRIYNKALTAEQVSANATIDQSRFNEQ